MEIPDSFNLSTLHQIIGHGQTGGVYEYIHNGESLAIKVCDIYNNREPYRNLRNEIGIYEHLKPLQGILIPRVRFHGRIGDIYVLAMDRINGVHLNLSIHDNEIANAKINSIVEILGSFGVEHGDLRKENILVESSENNELKLWIIDFGLAKLTAK
jgi:predicted Ser/Thr protein kinase